MLGRVCSNDAVEFSLDWGFGIKNMGIIESIGEFILFRVGEGELLLVVRGELDFGGIIVVVGGLVVGE